MDDFLHPWDERFHAVVARNFLSHPLVPTLYDATPLPAGLDWMSAHVFLHKPPLAMWFMSLSLRLFGECELALRIPSVLLLSVAVVATFRIGTILFDSRTGLLASFLLAVNGELLGLASGREATDHPDSMLISLVCVAAWCALEHARRPRAWIAAAAGALTGLAFLAKAWPALIVFVAWTFAAPKAGRSQLAVGAIVFAAVALPWHLYVRARFPLEAAAEPAYGAFEHVSHAVEGHARSAWFHLAELPRYFGELAPLAIVAFSFRRARTREGRIVLAWFVVPYVVFSLAATKMPAYAVIAAPAVTVMVAWAMTAAIDVLPRSTGVWKAGAVSIVAAWLVLPVVHGLAWWQPFAASEDLRAEARALRQLSPRPDSVLFGVADPISAMFYLNVPAYSRLPDEADLARCRRAGFRPTIVQVDAARAR